MHGSLVAIARRAYDHMYSMPFANAKTQYIVLTKCKYPIYSVESSDVDINSRHPITILRNCTVMRI